MSSQNEGHSMPVAALYYPYMRPPRRWLARTLLYVDVAGSIVQPDDEHQVFPLLQESGAFRPCAVASVLGELPDKAALVDEVVERVSLHPLDPIGEPDLLLPRKLPAEVSERLLDAGLFERHPEGLAATSSAAMPNLLAVVADRVSPELSSRDGLAWRPATDRADAFESFDADEEHGVAVVLALPGLPQPRFANDDDFRRLLDFRGQHRAELAAYRTQLDAVVARIATDAESATDAIDALADELQEHALQVSALRDLPSVKEIGSDLVISVGVGGLAGTLTGGPGGGAVGGGAGALRSLWANRSKVKAAVVGRKQRRDLAHLNYLVEAEKAGLLR